MPQVQISSPIWLRWASIAVRHERLAEVARLELKRQKAEGLPLDILREFEASLVSVTAAASSIDALYAMLRPLVDAETRAQWDKKESRDERASRSSYVFETLKRVAGIRQHMNGRIKGLYELRHAAFHHSWASRPTKLHPCAELETAVAKEEAEYTVEAAREAVSLMLELAQAAMDCGKMERGLTAAWQQILDSLADERRQPI